MKILKLKTDTFNLPSDLGFKFRDARLLKFYSLEFLAEHTGLSNADELLRFEQGIIHLPLNKIYALANVLELSPKLVLEWLCLPN